MEPYHKTIAELDELLRRRKPIAPRTQKQNETVPAATYKLPPRLDEPPIAIEHGMIICNFEYACDIYNLMQKSANTVYMHCTLLHVESIPN